MSNSKRVKKATDHLGKEYETEKAMCEAYGVSLFLYRSRIRYGISQKEALTIPAGELKAATDHLGNKFKSKYQMCLYYNISPETYDSRVMKGMSIKEALTTPTKGGPTKSTDHLGRAFKTQKEMCSFWGVPEMVYEKRISRGWSIEKSLTTPPKKKPRLPSTDHNGMTYESFEKMCDAYGANSDTVKYRLSRGASLEEALEAPLGKGNFKQCTDHLGKQYGSVGAMCETYNIKPSLYRKRLHEGWSQKDALTAPIYYRSKKSSL